jgi:glutamate--cysteine ligase
MAHLAQVREVADPLGIGFLGLGMSPKWTRKQIPVMPKGRYKIMTNYMPKVGSLGLDMMFRTCTVQANLDFSSEADMVKKLRVSLALQPVATALFANSPFTEGKPNGFCRSARKSGATPTMRAPACCPSRSRTAWASSAMSITRSTCRCISSSAATTYHDVAGIVVPRSAGRQASRVPGERARSPTGPTISRTIFPECGSSAIWRCAAPTAGRWSRICRAAGLLGRPAL